MKYTAIVIDGFHQGHIVRMIGYSPVLKLLEPKTIVVDYCCDESEYPYPSNEIEYKACFHAVDKRVVLYSTTGESEAMLGNFTLFDKLFSEKPWTPKTTLKIGYHNEPIIRIDEK